MAININQKSENNQELLGLSYYENGKRNPDIKTLLTLSDYFNVSIDYIIRGHEFQKR